MTWFWVFVVGLLSVMAALTLVDMFRRVAQSDMRREASRLPIDRSGL